MTTTQTASGETWDSRYHGDVDAIAKLLGEEGVSLRDADLIDVTTGDGVVALGLVERSGARVVAFDEAGCDVDGLRRRASAQAGLDTLPTGLRISHRNATELPTPDASFDVAVVWNGFHLAQRPVELLNELRRVLRPQGVLLLRLDPLWVGTGPDGLDPWRADGFTLDEAQRCLMTARYRITRVKLRSHPVRIPAELGRYPLSQLAIAGVTLLAMPER